VVFPGWAVDAETVVNTHRLLQYRCYDSVVEGLERQVPGTALAATPTRLLPENVDPIPGPLGETGRCAPQQSAEPVAFVAVSVTRMGVRWKLAGRCFGQMRPNPVLVERLAFVQGDDPMDARPRCARRSRGDVPTTRCAR
jgi:hypothetical protein